MEIANATTSHMKVNPNGNLPKTAPAAPATKPAPAADARTVSTDFQASTKLALKLAATPDVRADQVARAKALVADPNYPDAKTIQKVAQQLAKDLQAPVRSE